jgi:hypothetical protein
MTQEVEVVEEPQTPEVEEFDYEGSARSEGWVSKEEWVEAGKPEGAWKPAKDFYEAGQQILPIVQAKNKRLESELNDLRTKVERMAKNHDMTLQMQKEAWEKELKTAKARAIRDGDGDKVNEIDDQLSKLRQQPSAQEYANPEAQQALAEFMSQNEWYRTDEDMALYADALAMKIRSQDQSISPRELLTRVAAKTSEAFKKPSKKTPTVESSTRGSPRQSKRKDFDSLPSDAKATCERFLDNIPTNQRDTFRQKYVENYYSGEQG